MDKLITSLLQIVTLPVRVMLALFLIGLAILYLPDKYLSAAKLYYFRQPAFTGWVALATWGFLFLAMAAVVRKVWGNWAMARARAHWYEMIPQQLAHLTDQERLYLAYCLSRGTTTLYLTLIDNAGHALCEKGLLVRAQGVGSAIAWPYIIPSHVWQWIQRHSEQVASPQDMILAEPHFLELESKMNPHFS